MSILPWIRLLRPHQWTKNGFIFLPLIFSMNLFHSTAVDRSLVVFIVFCAISSAAYIVNDVLDRDRDRYHPRKSNRPVASGAISVLSALTMAGVLVAVGILLSWTQGLGVMMISILYLLLQVAYNLTFKNFVLWDVLFLAAGFLLRILAGAEAAGVPISFWLFMCVFVLALFLGFGKRRGELASLKGAADQHRGVLASYSVYYLDQVILLCSCLAIVFYGLYTVSPEVVARVQGHRMVASIIFVIYGILRYLYLIHAQCFSTDDPAELFLKDKPLLITVLCWVFMSFWVLYLR